MPNKQDYIADLRAAVERMHECAAHWTKTETVHETHQGKTVWIGDVEVFGLLGHHEAKRAYAWAHLEGDKDDKTRYVAVLELPPVKDAKTAVQASILADLKKGLFGQKH
jgi:hypothetical protein